MGLHEQVCWVSFLLLAIPLGSLLKESSVVLINFLCLLKSIEENHFAFLLSFSAQMQLLSLEINFDSMEMFRSVSHKIVIT